VTALRRWCPWAVVAAAAALLLAPLDPGSIERLYSTRLYLYWQPALTRVSNAVPFAIFDVILLGALATAIGIIAGAVSRMRRGDRWRALGVASRQILIAVAVLYLWFLASWGLNYRRVPLLDRLVLDRPAPTAAVVAELGRRAVEQMNALHPMTRKDPVPAPHENPTLVSAFEQTLRFLSDGPAARPGRLKRSLVGPFFRWASVDGMIDPFALEVLANPDLLPFELPFVAAHEWAHLGGYADESEASFVGWLTCMRADESAQYSAWLFLYWEIRSVVGAAERESLAMALEPGPRNDLEAVAERVRRGQLPRLRTISWTAYDHYLKANRVEEGVRSYDAVVTLLARARFEGNWVPSLRSRD
jgi:hypothetical protein